ncbi:DUF6402 family protein [Paraburkholderia fungorum]|uniref:DUF6402 family protein n=1 Tax=Paraburkholderia fungorum TaxID=134537 RepID=UPI0038BCE393
MLAILRGIDRFKTWRDTPDPPKQRKAEKQQSRQVPPFDIQQIPEAMRKEDMPISAKLMERWFAGVLNYSPTDADEGAELSQDGKPYPESMVDRTTIKMKWVLGYGRAQRQYEHLLSDLIYSDRARTALTKILRRHVDAFELRPWTMCGNDLRSLHKKFQFQRALVGSTLNQRFMQLIERVPKGAVPDDLCGALGSFNLYAAIAGAKYSLDRKSAVVTHIVVYIKDNYTFDAIPDSRSQYLGHWNKNGIIVVPALELLNMAGVPWLDYPVVTGANTGDLYKDGKVFYPVRNHDFRTWQLKHKRGGDFIILSDYIPIFLKRPITVYI